MQQARRAMRTARAMRSAWMVRLAGVLAIGAGAAACDGALRDEDDGGGAAPELAEGAIINGTSAPNITPLTASEVLAIGFLQTTSGDNFCSGTVIRRDAVLTAYHCVEDKRADQIRFGIGDPAAPKALVEVSRIALATWDTDIALLNLKYDATGVDGLVPIPFNRDALDGGLIGDDVEIAGYAPIDNVWRRRFGVVEVTNVFEALTLNGNGQSGSCQGDSGGPVLIVGADGNARVAGTAIGGNISCRDEMYYSRVDLLEAWVDEQLATFTVQSGPVPSGGSSASDPWGCRDSDCRGALSPNLVALGLALAVLVVRRALLVRESAAAGRASERSNFEGLFEPGESCGVPTGATDTSPMAGRNFATAIESAAASRRAR